MVWFNVLYMSDHESINVMLLKIEHGGFPPTSRFFMHAWVIDQLCMLARIPDVPDEFRYYAMMRMSNLACVDPIWKELYNRAICLGWRLFKFTIWDPDLD